MTQQAKMFSALILASGLSERMGTPKALLKWDESTSFLEKIIREYLAAGCRPVVCTVNDRILPHCNELENLPDVQIILNPHPEWSRLYSVRLGLEALKDNPYCLLQNVDNPLINRNVIVRILNSADPDAWCSPEYNMQGGHPVLLPKKIMDQIIHADADGMTLRSLLDSFPKKVVEIEDDCILKNINTPADYEILLNRKW